VGATREEVLSVVRQFQEVGVERFVALRGDPQGGFGSAYQPFEGGFANAADLTAGLAAHGIRDISVSAYPEKHPESRDIDGDIDMLKRKVDAGATRAITQFFFDNAIFARYLERVRAAGIEIPILPGILPIQNLAQVKKFASLCGASVPRFVEDVLGPVDDNPAERALRSAELASRQVRELIELGITEFHFYTMNRVPLIESVLEQSGFRRSLGKETAAA
jgi:methylenetetrahydrofolate reductase (NADPH)